MAGLTEAETRLLAALRENAWDLPDVAEQIGADAIPILLDIDVGKYDVHPHDGIDPRDWFDMQTHALTRVGQSRLDLFITEVAKRDAETKVGVLLAIKGMQNVSSQQVLPILLKGIAAQGHLMEISRWAAIDALGEHRHPAAIEPIISALRDPDPLVQITAINALARYGDRRAIEPLRAYAADPAKQARTGFPFGALDRAREVADLIEAST